MFDIKNDYWGEILSSILEKKLGERNIKGVGGIYGLDGKKYTAKDYFHISEPTAKTIADLFANFDALDEGDELVPAKNLPDLKDGQPLNIENEDFLIISLNSRILYATNDKHCIFAYRCRFSFLLLLFSNFENVEPKSLLFEKLENQQDISHQQNKPIYPEIYARVVLAIANEIISQGG